MRGHVKRKGRNWYVVLELEPIEIDGKLKRNTKWISVRKELGLNKPATKRQAEELLVKKLREVQEGTYIEPHEMTIKELLDQWLEVYAKANLRPTTYTKYKRHITNHIIPAIGSIEIAKIKPLHIEKLLVSKRTGGRLDGKEGGLSSSTIMDLYKILSGVFQSAVKWELVQRNIMDAVAPPKQEKSALKVWNPEQVKWFLSYLRDHRLYPFYSIALSTGMRRGELLGLRWQDIDWDNQRLAISQTLVVVNGRLQLSKGKTRGSHGVIALSDAEITILRRQRRRQLEELIALGKRNDADLVFLSEEGTPLHPGNLLRHLQTTADIIGLPRITLHGLRHTCATLMLLAGVHPKVVAERLRHSRISTAMDLYSHVLPSMQREAADKLSDLVYAKDILSTEGENLERTSVVQGRW